MKKTLMALVLAPIIAISTMTAQAGDMPMVGVQGCAPGILWVPSNICCQPNMECPVDEGGRATVQSPTKEESIIDLFLNIKEVFRVNW